MRRTRGISRSNRKLVVPVNTRATVGDVLHRICFMRHAMGLDFADSLRPHRHSNLLSPQLAQFDGCSSTEGSSSAGAESIPLPTYNTSCAVGAKAHKRYERCVANHACNDYPLKFDGMSKARFMGVPNTMGRGRDSQYSRSRLRAATNEVAAAKTGQRLVASSTRFADSPGSYLIRAPQMHR